MKLAVSVTILSIAFFPNSAQADTGLETLHQESRRFVVEPSEISARCIDSRNGRGGVLVLKIRGRDYKIDDRPGRTGWTLGERCENAAERIRKKLQDSGTERQLLVIGRNGEDRLPVMLPLSSALQCKLGTGELPYQAERPGCAEPITIMRVRCGPAGELTVACNGRIADPTRCFHEQLNAMDSGVDSRAATSSGAAQ